MNFFDHKNLGNHLLQLCPKVVKHPVYKESVRIPQKAQKKNRKYVIKKKMSAHHEDNFEYKTYGVLVKTWKF